MVKDIQMMRDKLEYMLIEKPVNSQEVLKLSKELDVLILEFYKGQSFPEKCSYNKIKY